MVVPRESVQTIILRVLVCQKGRMVLMMMVMKGRNIEVGGWLMIRVDAILSLNHPHPNTFATLPELSGCRSVGIPPRNSRSLASYNGSGTPRRQRNFTALLSDKTRLIRFGFVSV